MSAFGKMITQTPQQKDFEVQPALPDGVSDMHWCPTADYLSASSWDGRTRVWQVNPDGTSSGKTEIPHDAPSLCTRWSRDGAKLFSGGADKIGKVMDMNTGQIVQVAAHDAPIRCARWLNVGSLNDVILTGSWDKTLRYWDMRQQTPIFTAPLKDRVFAMDTSQNLLVVGTGDRQLLLYDLNNPAQLQRSVDSPLKFQTRTIACFPDARGFAVGSVEGRVGIQYVDPKDAAANFSFKCHRDDKNIYSVNSIQFHPVLGTFSTAGSDGGFNFWDKDSKQRLKQFPSSGTPIPCSAFNRNGSIFAYAYSYDWSRGYEASSQQNNKNQIFLHATREEDVKPRPAKTQMGKR
ncbi:hypothetical protein HDV00_007787 [Rhizophlyctis rosea]|nr:hypothetical protein HDV00_007787 [Rhizophlyctis rosea]